jgi:hypothetical protein
MVDLSSSVALLLHHVADATRQATAFRSHFRVVNLLFSS